MKTVMNYFVLMMLTAAFCLAMVGCNSPEHGDHPTGDHPKADKAEGDHPKGDHPK